MNATDREELIEELLDGRNTLVEAAAGVTEEEAAESLDNGWCVRACVEHCVLAEIAMLAMITGPGEPAEPGDRSKFEASIRKYAPTRARKVQATKAMLPAGRFATLAQALAAFSEARERTIAYVETCDGDLRDRMVQHPVGKVTARECLLLLISHPVRHAEQIWEIRRAG